MALGAAVGKLRSRSITSMVAVVAQDFVKPAAKVALVVSRQVPAAFLVRHVRRAIYSHWLLAVAVAQAQA
jgi:hypothetical protein